MGDLRPPSRVPDPDAERVRLARQGSYEAFEELVSQYERPMYNLAMRIVRRREDAEDVVQQTFLSVLEHLDGFNGQSLFRTWLVRIATNHALKILRKKRGLPSVSFDDGGDEDAGPLPHPEFIAPWQNEPDQVAQQHEIQHLLAEAMDQLDEKYRLVFILRDVEGLPTEDAAEALGISVANAKVRLLRARLMLRELLTRTLGDPDQRVRGHEHE
ncbi:MAG: RNA polymerase sigma factor [Tepidisphaerales bacterium]